MERQANALQSVHYYLTIVAGPTMYQAHHRLFALVLHIMLAKD